MSSHELIVTPLDAPTPAEQATRPMSPLVLLAGLPAGTDDWLREQLAVRVLAVETRADALEALNSGEPSLVVVGWKLEDADGEDIVEAARANPTTALVPIVFWLGRGPTADQAARLVHTHGVTRLLVDPPPGTALFRAVSDILGVGAIGGDQQSQGESRISAGMSALWVRFRDQIFQRVDVLERFGEALLEGTTDEDGRRAAEREAHKLAGSAGTFGFARASSIARDVELLLTGSRIPAGDGVRRYRDLVEQLRRELEERDPERRDGSGRNAEMVLVVDVEQEFGRQLRAVAASHGTDVRMMASGPARQRVLECRPELVILDATANGQRDSRVELLRVLAAAEPPIPVLILGDSDSQARRTPLLERQDHIFLRKPVSAEEVSVHAQRIVETVRPERGRIVAVDDDPQVLEVVRTILLRDGFEVKHLGDPLHLLRELETGPPDLLILDLDMPHLGGIEICSLVRAHPTWQGVPIVLMTANRDADVVQRVFAAGADDFVLKPIVGPELITRVANRLERARLYRAMAETDSLTGVANRRKSTEQFQQLNRLALRNSRPLSFAILDIDHFKSINDRFGHCIGDRVLREFAEFLLKTFREEDVVGRWGGEEFILGLYGMTREQCIGRLQRVIRDFQTIPHEDGCGDVFHVTFSAGVAEFPQDGADLQGLYLAADQALYSAKAAGRARVRAVEARERDAARRIASALPTIVGAA